MEITEQWLVDRAFKKNLDGILVYAKRDVTISYDMVGGTLRVLSNEINLTVHAFNGTDRLIKLCEILDIKIKL